MFLGACDLGVDNGPVPEGNARKALVIGIDGLRGDGIPATDTPSLDQLMASGAWSLFASTQVGAPTMSGPGWTSILTGVDADKHGIFSNGGYSDIDRSYPTLLARAHELNLPTATAIHWQPIQLDIIEEGVVNEAMVGNDLEVADAMSEILENGDYDVHFVHLDDVDGAGHSSGFSPDNPDYLDVVRVTDGYVGRLTDAIAARATRSEEDWLVVVTSDHGGLGTSHGGVAPEIRAIPLIISGDGVSPGEFSGAGEVPGELDVGFVSHLDVHPTVMHYLGFPPQDDWGLDGEVRGLEP
jgi:predicted AlkP superfamily pyrophosphatase or phosphodiesterase